MPGVATTVHQSPVRTLIRFQRYLRRTAKRTLQSVIPIPAIPLFHLALIPPPFALRPSFCFGLLAKASFHISTHALRPGIIINRYAFKAINSCGARGHIPSAHMRERSPICSPTAFINSCHGRCSAARFQSAAQPEHAQRRCARGHLAGR